MRMEIDSDLITKTNQLLGELGNIIEGEVYNPKFVVENLMQYIKIFCN